MTTTATMLAARTGLRTGARASTCLVCKWRTFSTTGYQRLPTDHTPGAAAPDGKPKPRQTFAPAPVAATEPAPDSPLAHAPRSYGKKVKDFTPTPLSRPIGMNTPPAAGQNTGIDHRTFKQRRDDFVDYERHLAKREYLKNKVSRPYFRDWVNLSFHKGKTFLAPPRLFKADLSLYFPNLFGRTLASRQKADTTPLLAGHASVVTVFSGMWAENQIKTFVSPEQNPALHRVLKESGGRAQLVQINVEEDWMKMMLIKLFSWSLRNKVGKENWHRYFLVRKGITDEIKESVGLLNSKVGYTYLVDHRCRIRWAGSGSAEGDEREGLVKGVRRLLEEIKAEGVTGGVAEGHVLKPLAAGKPTTGDKK
ncbi:Mitochondrial ATPase complex subunit atp10 [Podospora bellae-mahoneyi]|uniref:Mitochondrial ATPase complex subunit atp10 n=1 Tax=Podospora bellae-mahoneyi TaxID=2093777 RepID=A0ABR0FZE6_9PEZI|nr:Mitochondrial ATPase complex subunit atp10 [Podospora bellae-mahoneyi]